MSTAGSRLPSLLDDSTTPQGSAATQSSGRGSAGPSVLNKDTLKAGFAVVCLIAATIFGYYQLTSGGPDLASNSLYREVVDSKTGESFSNFSIGEDNSAFPYTNPKTGQRTLYPAERCYYTRDGKVKSTPTLVFVKQYENENAGETACPDCGRNVIRHNPAPAWTLIEEAKQRESGKK